MKYVELALVSPKVLDAFIRLLYCASSSIMIGSASNLADEVPKVAKAAKEIDSLTETTIVDTLTKYALGKKVKDEVGIPDLKAARAALRLEIGSDKNITYMQLDQLKAGFAYMLTQNEGALRKLIKLAPGLKSPAYVKAFAFQPNSQSNFTKPLEKIVFTTTKELGTPRKGTTLTGEEITYLRENYPAVAKEYAKLRREFNLVWKDELRNYVAEQGGDLTDFQGAVEYLESQGIQHNMPEGFEGLVNANGELFTTAGKAIKGGVGPGFAIKMNPNYDPDTDSDFVFTTFNKDTGAKSGYAYTVDYRSKANNNKFEKVSLLMTNIDGIRKKWIPLVKKQNNSVECVTATLLELLYAFSARVGSAGNSAGGKPTQGLSTILVKNVKDDGNKIVIKYKGKDAVAQVHVLDTTTPEGKVLANNIRLMLADKDVNDFVFTAVKPNGRQVRVGGVLANKMFQGMGGGEATIHKFRHVRGTKLLQQLMEENESKIFGRKKPFTQAEAEETFKKLATQVGKMLGHVRGVGAQQKTTPSTAIQNYLDPGVMETFFDRLGLRAPRWIPKE